MFCTQCGQQNPDDSRFCARCGAPVGGRESAGATGDTTSSFPLSALEKALGDHEGEQGSGQPISAKCASIRAFSALVSSPCVAKQI